MERIRRPPILEALQLRRRSGSNFFDSAWAYGDGKSDSLLGQILANNPDKSLHAASKIPPKNGKWPASANNINIRMSFPRITYSNTRTKSAKKLGAETIDLLQLHVWTTPGRKNRNSAPRSKS